MAWSNPFPDAAPAGMQVAGIVLTRAIAQGGEGIVYDAMHPVHGDVLVKEFWPKQLATRTASKAAREAQLAWQQDYRRGVEKFIAMGERLAALPRHPGVFRVLDVIPQNNTAYQVMERVPGLRLDHALEQDAFAEPSEIAALATKLVTALAHIHANGLFHRDIAPDNIVITPGHDWHAVLIDFNAAKDIVQRVSRSNDGIVKPGYTPIEQTDTDGREPIGPWTDIYSASAVLYRCIAGAPPTDPAIRLLRPAKYTPLSKSHADKFPKALLTAVDCGLEPRPDDRPQSAEEWRQLLTGEISKPRRPRTRPAKSVKATARSPEQPAATAPFAQADPAAGEAVELEDIDDVEDLDDEFDAPPERPRQLRTALILGGLAAVALVGTAIAVGMSNQVDESEFEDAIGEGDPRLAALIADAREIEPGLWIKVTKEGGENPVRPDDMVVTTMQFSDLDGATFNNEWYERAEVADRFPFGANLLDGLNFGDEATVYIDGPLLQASNPALANQIFDRLNMTITSSAQAQLVVGQCVDSAERPTNGSKLRVPCMAGSWDVWVYGGDGSEATGKFDVADETKKTGILTLDYNNNGYAIRQECAISVINDVNLRCRIVDTGDVPDYSADLLELQVMDTEVLSGSIKNEYDVGTVTLSRAR